MENQPPMPVNASAPTNSERSTPLLRTARLLLRLYPRRWRERYADEMGHVLAQHRVTFWTLADLLIGAFDARLHSDLLPRRLVSMAHRIRTSEIAIFCAFVLFLVAWFPAQVGPRDPLPAWNNATTAHPEIRVALIALQWTAVIAVLALVVGGVPILLSTIKQLYLAHRWRRLALFAVPPIAAAALVVIALLLAGPSTIPVRPSDPTGQLTPLAAILQLILLALGCLVIAGSTAAVALGIGRSEVSARVARLALIPAAVVTMGIVAGVVACAILTWLILAKAPQLADPFSMSVLTAVMAVAAVIAIAALQRGLRAARQA